MICYFSYGFSVTVSVTVTLNNTGGQVVKIATIVVNQYGASVMSERSMTQNHLQSLLLRLISVITILRQCVIKYKIL